MKFSSTLAAALVLVLTVTTAEVTAQPYDPLQGHRVHYMAAVGADQARDDVLLPSRWDGVMVDLGLGYGYAAESWHLEGELSFATSYLEKGGGHPGIVMTPAFSVAAGFDVYTHDGIAIALGPLVRSRIDNGFYFSWDDARTYYLATHMLGFELGGSWTSGTLPTFTANLAMPLLGLAGRPPEIRFEEQVDAISMGNLFGTPNEDLGFATLPDFVAFELSLGVLWTDSESSLALDYALSFEHFAEPRPVEHLNHLLRFTHTFGVGQ